MEGKSYNIVCPIIILSDSNCSDAAKLLLVLIRSLSVKEGYCYATNGYLGKILGKKKDTISKIISKLSKEHYIYTKQIDNQRRIYLNPRLSENNTQDIVEKSDRGIVDKSYYNNKRKNIKKNNIEQILGIDENGNETWNGKPMISEDMNEEEGKVFQGYVDDIINTIDSM